jgi:hypothetical protein
MKADSTPLNENQQRRLAVTCRYVDRLLSDVELVLTQSASRSPFAPYVDDLTSAQRVAVADSLRAMRDALIARHGLTAGGAALSAAHSIRTNLTFVDVAVEELMPRYMRGYGEVAPAAVTELNSLVEELHAIVRQMDALVAHVDAEGRSMEE